MSYAVGTLTIIFGILTIVGRKRLDQGNIILAGLIILMHGINTLLRVKP